jgi:hypothetical protein
MRRGGLVLAAGLLFTPPLTAQRADSLDITAAELGARLRLISSDAFEGRYPGTRGETLTTTYLVNELKSFGLKGGAAPAGPDPAALWLQPVAMTTHRPDSTSPNEARLSGRVTRRLEHGSSIRLVNLSARSEVQAGGELVFVGYGISAPAYGWDDFGGLDLHGKVAVALLGEPAIAGDTVRFNGVRASRYSWSREKLQEMERRGAVGVLWLQRAGSLSRSRVTGMRRLAGEAVAATLLFGGGLTDSTLATLLPPDGPPLDSLVARAARPGFRPVSTGVRLDVRFRTRPEVVTSHNVIATVPGRDPRLRNEHVLLSAHWDAYGVGPAVAGDSIYNGALDDGSGVTALLALARVFAKHPQPRSITFLFTTAEEWGLLGARAFVCGGPLLLSRIVANVNLDGGNELFGPTRDVAPLGIELSTLGQTVADVARRSGLTVTPDPYPAEGYFLRADNFPLAAAGVPALYMALGTDGLGVPAGFVDQKIKEYLDRSYHQPSDEYENVVLDLNGAKQFAELVRDVTVAIASSPERPRWNPGAEFQRPANKRSGGTCPIQ